VSKYQSVDIPNAPGWMLMNPPYGERLELKDILGFYKEIGDRMKQDYKGWQAWIISSNFEAMKKIGLKPLKRINLFNGPLACKFQGYDLY
ncbi:MAG: class I SAM-dependent RNA methyltransferase, partial [Cyanobacteria bacterium J06600_6]